MRSEDLACEFLAKNGFAIVARNFRTRHAEIDIVAEKDGRICFIEVRSAATLFLNSPLLTITYPKQKRLIRAAREYFYRRKMREKNSEFDVIGIVYDGESVRTEFVRDAFRASDHERA
ncbi:MAG: YraN family protein [Deltaproteobacteria bacterium]|nr:YraN family protein [Deltaproteobacteria bacterium]